MSHMSWISTIQIPLLLENQNGKISLRNVTNCIIQYSNNLFSNLALLVKNKDNLLRFCVDYKALNQATILDCNFGGWRYIWQAIWSKNHFQIKLTIRVPLNKNEERRCEKKISQIIVWLEHHLEKKEIYIHVAH